MVVEAECLVDSSTSDLFDLDAINMIIDSGIT
ncbi:MAG: hypothetical protein ACJAWS_003332 [Oleiphilaceae bacterium]|jgi:hypothetical protein